MGSSPCRAVRPGLRRTIRDDTSPPARTWVECRIRDADRRIALTPVQVLGRSFGVLAGRRARFALAYQGTMTVGCMRCRFVVVSRGEIVQPRGRPCPGFAISDR